MRMEPNERQLFALVDQLRLVHVQHDPRLLDRSVHDRIPKCITRLLNPQARTDGPERRRSDAGARGTCFGSGFPDPFRQRVLVGEVFLFNVDEQRPLCPDLAKPSGQRRLPAAGSALVDSEYGLFAAFRLSNGGVEPPNLVIAASEEPRRVPVPLFQQLLG